MKICRFDDNRLGLVEGDVIKDVTHVLDRLPPFRVPLPRHDPLIAALELLRPEMLAAAADANSLPLSEVMLLTPVANPGKIVAAPVNYTKHLHEVLGNPGLHHGQLINAIEKAGLFLKATSSLIDPSEPVRLSHLDRRNDHEVELAVIIGKRASRLTRENALESVAGYSIGLDMTLRGPEERSFRKSIDSYTVVGPWLVTADELGDAGDLDISISVNGETRQHANTSELIMSVPDLLVFATSFYTLHPGDILLTGTPQGVGPVRPGDSMTASIARIGTIRVDVGAA